MLGVEQAGAAFSNFDASLGYLAQLLALKTLAPFKCISHFAFSSQALSSLFRNFNRPFPSSLVPLFQSESKCETFHMKMSSARSFFFMQIKVIFIRMVSHLDSL